MTAHLGSAARNEQIDTGIFTANPSNDINDHANPGNDDHTKQTHGKRWGNGNEGNDHMVITTTVANKTDDISGITNPVSGGSPSTKTPLKSHLSSHRDKEDECKFAYLPLAVADKSKIGPKTWTTKIPAPTVRKRCKMSIHTGIFKCKTRCTFTR